MTAYLNQYIAVEMLYYQWGVCSNKILIRCFNAKLKNSKRPGTALEKMTRLLIFLSDKYLHKYVLSMDIHNTNNVFWNWILELSSKYGGMKERLSKENIPILSLDDSQKHKEKYLSYSNRNLSKLWFCHISVIK